MPSPEFFADESGFAALTFKNITQDEVNAIMATEEPAKTRLFLFVYDALEGLYQQVQKTWPNGIDSAPRQMHDPLQYLLDTQLTVMRTWGWMDENGNPTDKCPS